MKTYRRNDPMAIIEVCILLIFNMLVMTDTPLPLFDTYR
jgi:hypothetical protein